MLVDALDTGVTVMYAGSKNANCSEYRYCASYGQFDPRNSSSFSSNDEDWEDLPTFTTGFDRLTLGDVQATNVSLGLVAVDDPYSC